MLFSYDLPNLHRDDKRTLDLLLEEYPEIRDTLLPVLRDLDEKISGSDSNAEKLTADIERLEKELRAEEEQGNGFAEERDYAERRLSAALERINDLESALRLLSPAHGLVEKPFQEGTEKPPAREVAKLLREVVDRPAVRSAIPDSTLKRAIDTCAKFSLADV